MAIAPGVIPQNLPQTGDVLDGKYQIEDVLGSGGMGIVVSARHLLMGQRVAIKFLLHTSVMDPHARERLLREARALAGIKSEHVARVLDVGELASGAPYMVMEHLVGTDLSRLRRAHGVLRVSDAVDAILQAGEAIAEAHALGIVHRDLKPSNLFVIARPDRSLAVKVLDFGLSKVEAPHRGAPRLTKTDVVAGSPQYMAPEQMRSLKHADHRSDIWSLGVILYYLMSGHRPYEGRSIPSLWAAIKAGKPAALCLLRPEVPAALDALVMRCVERDPAQRVQSVGELAQGLAPFASARGRLSVDWIVHTPPPSRG